MNLWKTWATKNISILRGRSTASSKRSSAAGAGSEVKSEIGDYAYD
jgi:hypothetical protein